MTLTLPRHSARYLVRRLREERELLARNSAFCGLLQIEAEFDSLDALECAIPADLWEECNG